MPRMPFSGRRSGHETPTGRAWFVTVRLLELAAAVGAFAVLFQIWLAYTFTSQSFGPNGMPAEGGPGLLDRLAMMAGFGFGFATEGVLVGSVLLLGAVAVLHVAKPVEHAGVLRWELVAVWGALVLATVLLVVPPVVAVLRGDPNAPGEGVVTFEPGPGFAVQQLSWLPLPLAGGVLLALVALWWLRLPSNFDEPEESGKHVEGAVRPRAPRDTPPSVEETDGLGHIVVDEVEQIEPVERLVPRERAAGDGATNSGYEDYFRRF